MNKYILLISVVIFSGCASFWDAPRNVVGVSTRALENARKDSVFQVYACEYADCFNAVVDSAEKSKYIVFMKDQIRGLVVIMNIPGVVDTTEVGVFIAPLANHKGVKVELSSRSTPARRAVAQILFTDLAARFPKS
ncbi:MAG: hypothetical protein HQL19_07300 [Candidatus Omnitrophica bacterium]|nr:hypothetical protein [Candidatus Omnitrophota bacterium]